MGAIYLLKAAGVWRLSLEDLTCGMVLWNGTRPVSGHGPLSQTLKR